MQNGYFRSVRALPDFRLEVEMETDTFIQLDFHSRLRTIRFGDLRDEELFQSVRTDGNYLIFQTGPVEGKRITAWEFLDLVMLDRTK